MVAKKVQIINNNFLDEYSNKDTEGEYELIILVDIVWQFISPLYDEAERDAIQWIYKNLKKGGMVLLELEDYSQQIEDIKDNGAYRFWEKFPKDDPFKYGLYKLDLDDDENVMDEKIFIRRDNMKEESFTNIIKSYTRKESIDMLKRYGMKAKIFPYYDANSEMGKLNEHDLYRVLAQK